MTISTESIKAGPFAGNASTTTFAFSYKVFAQADLAVIFTSTVGVESTKTLTTDYSVSLNSDISEPSVPFGFTYKILTSDAEIAPSRIRFFSRNMKSSLCVSTIHCF